MRLLILKDKKITTKELDTLKSEFSAFINKYTGLTPEYYELEQDYTSVPTEPDSDGDLKPTKAYLTSLTDKVHSIYGLWGIDSVVILIHRDNWKLTGIWGSNFSNQYRTYHVHLCRFDNKNMANSLGTLYHEWMHSLDVLIKTHTGFDINTLFKNTKCWVDWDATATHGNKFSGCQDTPYKYIRWKENSDTLVAIAPYLKQAYNRRKEMYLEPYKKIQLQVIDWLRSLLNQKTTRIK